MGARPGNLVSLSKCISVKYCTEQTSPLLNLKTWIKPFHAYAGMVSTIVHSLWLCPVVKALWDVVRDILSKILNTDITIYLATCLLGIQPNGIHCTSAQNNNSTKGIILMNWKVRKEFLKNEYIDVLEQSMCWFKIMCMSMFLWTHYVSNRNTCIK